MSTIESVVFKPTVPQIPNNGIGGFDVSKYLTSRGELGSGSTSSVTNPILDYNNAEGLFGLTNGTWNNLGQMAGLAGTAYGLYDSLLGDKSKLFKEQIGMLRDQRKYNDKMIADRAKYKENIGSGLAAAFASPAKTSNVASPAYVK